MLYIYNGLHELCQVFIAFLSSILYAEENALELLLPTSHSIDTVLQQWYRLTPQYEFGGMSLKIKLFALEDESGIPQWIIQVSANDSDSYSILQVKLEEVGALDWPFDFWDVKERCRVSRKFKSLQVIKPLIYAVCVSTDKPDLSK